MPKCKNDSTRSYKGSEPSPKGLGYCAHAEKVGTTKKGKDGNLWIIAKRVSGKYWKRVSSTNKDKKILKKKIKVTDLYDTKEITNAKFKKIVDDAPVKKRVIIKKLKKVVKDFKKIGLTVLLVPLVISSTGVYWEDFPHDVFLEKYPDININYLIIIVYINKIGKEYVIDLKYIKINHLIDSKDRKIKLIKILDDNFKNYYKWDGSNSRSILIYYDKQKNTKQKLYLETKDEYPLINVLFIFASPNINLFETDIYKVSIVKTIISEIKKRKYRYDLVHGKNDIYLTIKNAKDMKKMVSFLKKVLDKGKKDKEYKIKRYKVSSWLEPEYYDPDKKSKKKTVKDRDYPKTYVDIYFKNIDLTKLNINKIPLIKEIRGKIKKHKYDIEKLTDIIYFTIKGVKDVNDLEYFLKKILDKGKKDKDFQVEKYKVSTIT